MSASRASLDVGERRRRLSSEADRIATTLAEEGAVLVVAFGSFGRGQETARSDLDVLAVLPTDEPFPARLIRLYEQLAPRVALDLLVYTPEEFEEVRDRAFIRAALEEGRVLYAA